MEKISKYIDIAEKQVLAVRERKHQYGRWEGEEEPVVLDLTGNIKVNSRRI